MGGVDEWVSGERSGRQQLDVGEIGIRRMRLRDIKRD